MKTKLLSLIIIIFSITTCYAQPEVKTIVNDKNAVKRNVGNFTGIDVSNAITVYLTQGNEDAVAVSCNDENDLKKIKTVVKNGVLKIYLDNGFWNAWSWKNKKIKAYVSMKTIDFIGVSGASIVKISETIKCSNLNLEVSGASHIKGDIQVFKLNIDASGASSIEFSGIANDASIELSGASSMKSLSLITNESKIEASGASSIIITVKEKLKAEASGASSIRYKGTPTIIHSNSSGAASIKSKID